MAPDRRSAILAAARRAVGRRGYSATSMRDVAGEAGVAQGLIHYYYATKDALLVAVVRAMLDEQLARLRKRLEEVRGPPRARAQAGLAAARDKTLGDKRQWRLFFEVLAADSRDGRGKLAEAFAERRALVSDVVAEARGRRDAASVALLVDALMLGLAAERLAGTADAEIEAAYDLFTRMVDTEGGR